MKTLKKYFRSGFTLIELLVVISIVAILIGLTVPSIAGALTRAQMMGALSNLREIHKSTFTAASDAVQTGATNFGWPGDVPTVTDVQTFASMLVTNDFLKPLDAIKVFTATGIKQGTATETDVTIGMENCAFNIYKVQEGQAGLTVFGTTKNYTYNTELSDTLPFKNNGFVVVRMSGDGAVYRVSQYADTNIIGPLPTNSTAPLQ